MFTIGLLILLCKDNVLVQLDYTYRGGQLAVLPGKAENLRNVNCSCHGSDTGGVNLTVPVLPLSLYIYIHLAIALHVAVK